MQISNFYDKAISPPSACRPRHPVARGAFFAVRRNPMGMAEPSHYTYTIENGFGELDEQGF
jgi:hypothetical protein